MKLIKIQDDVMVVSEETGELLYGPFDTFRQARDFLKAYVR